MRIKRSFALVPGLPCSAQLRGPRIPIDSQDVQKPHTLGDFEIREGAVPELVDEHTPIPPHDSQADLRMSKCHAALVHKLPKV